MTQAITEEQALRAIVGRLELELRTTQAFLAIAILSQGNKIEAAKEHFDSLPNDFEVAVYRDDEKVTYTVLSGDEAEQYREAQVVANPIVV